MRHHMIAKFHDDPFLLNWNLMLFCTWIFLSRPHLSGFFGLSFLIPSVATSVFRWAASFSFGSTGILPLIQQKESKVSRLNSTISRHVDKVSKLERIHGVGDFLFFQQNRPESWPPWPFFFGGSSPGSEQNPQTPSVGSTISTVGSVESCHGC